MAKVEGSSRVDALERWRARYAANPERQGELF